MMARTGCADTEQNKQMFGSGQYRDDDYIIPYTNYHICGHEDPDFYYNDKGEFI
jgi:hypothetical protein